MPRNPSPSSTPKDVLRHYETTPEGERLRAGVGRLERVRTLELLDRHLPAPPAQVIDVGGGSGVYAVELARRGFEVVLVDPVPVHLEEARSRARAVDVELAGVVEADARALPQANASADVLLLMGPLYHLVERSERDAALDEACRVLRPGGLLVAAAISRYASALDGLARHLLDDPAFERIVIRDLATGHHENPAAEPDYFTTAYLHRPEELAEELEEANLAVEAIYGVEGAAWLLGDFDARWADARRRCMMLEMAQAMELEPAIRGVSAHLLAIAHAR